MYSIDCRPFHLNQIAGNKAIVSEMKKRSIDINFPEVMIFEGKSGTGKTTMAFLLASLLSDKNRVKLEGENYYSPNIDSMVSKSIRDESFNRDVLFFDASSMGKEGIVALNDTVDILPFHDERRVIIIDEAQELSKAGKGSTLKLLEKKRKSTHIILCTMNIESFDVSVKSRGQVYTFRPPTSSEIADYLISILGDDDLEKLPDEFFSKTIFTISESCEGNVRQAVQLLERCIMAELYTPEALFSELQVSSSYRINQTLVNILNRKPEVIDEIVNGYDIKDFYYQTRRLLLEALVCKNVGFSKSAYKETMLKALIPFDLEDLLESVFQSNGYYLDIHLFLYNLSMFVKPKMVRKLVE